MPLQQTSIYTRAIDRTIIEQVSNQARARRPKRRTLREPPLRLSLLACHPPRRLIRTVMESCRC